MEESMGKPRSRTAFVPTRHRTRAVTVVAALAGTLALAACGATTTTDPDATARPGLTDGPEILAGSFETVAFGDPTARVRALRALAAGTSVVRLRMTRTTVEGDPITYYLIVEGGSARLLVDWRQDRFGGGRSVTDERFTDVWLARMNAGDEPPTKVDPSGPLPAGIYFLRGFVCPNAESCLRDF